MQERGDQLHLHPLAERKFANRLSRELADTEEFDEFVEGFVELLGRERVDLALELEAIRGGKVPPELILLAHHERKLPSKRVDALRGDESENLRAAAGRINQAREHLERRGLARAVGTEKGDHFAGLDGEADVVDRLNFLVIAFIEPSERAEQPFFFLEDTISLRQTHRFNDRHGLALTGQEGVTFGPHCREVEQEA